MQVAGKAGVPIAKATLYSRAGRGLHGTSQDPAKRRPPEPLPCSETCRPGGTYQMIQPFSRNDPFTIVTLDGQIVRVRNFADLADPAAYFWSGV